MLKTPAKPNYGSMDLTENVLVDSKIAPIDTPVRVANVQQMYTSSPFFNDLLQIGVQQLVGFFNPQKVAMPASHKRLKEIFNSNEHACLPLLIQTLTATELSDENTRCFISLVDEVLLELGNEQMKNKVKKDFIFVLKTGLSIFEGDAKVKIIQAIQCFENSIKQCELEEARSLHL